MFTVKNILDATKKTHNKVWKNKGNVTIQFTSVKEWKDTKGKKVKTVKGKATDRAAGSGKPHYLEIDYYGKGKNAKVWVTCDCEYFLFNCEVALWNDDSSSIQWSNGNDYSSDGPNPSAAPRACKHLVAALALGADKLTVTHRSKKIVDRE